MAAHKVDTSAHPTFPFLGLDTPPHSPSVEKQQQKQGRFTVSVSRLPDTPETASPASSSPVSRSSDGPEPTSVDAIAADDLDLAAEITQQDAPHVAVIGVGYVGTHLVESFSDVYPVLGFDVSQARVDLLRAQGFCTDKNVTLTTRRADLRAATHFLISVPTLLREDRSVNASYLRSALDLVSEIARPGATIVVESSVAVGMTRALLGPICAERRFFGGMSPERVDPGRTDPPTRAIPKIISGLSPADLDAISRVYTPVFDTVVPVSAPEVAEMTKLYENCQRMMCIAYANEMADACAPLGIDPFEVASAASSKPFGYMPFTPSAGVGGHCIPVNPYYLLSTCPQFSLLKAAADTMGARPAAIASRVAEELKTIANPKVLVVGVGFKAGQSVLSNSPGQALAEALLAQDTHVMFADPLVPQSAIPQVPRMDDADWTAERLVQFDKIVVVVRQPGVDFDILEGLPVDVEMWSRK